MQAFAPSSPSPMHNEKFDKEAVDAVCKQLYDITREGVSQQLSHMGLPRSDLSPHLKRLHDFSNELPQRIASTFLRALETELMPEIQWYKLEMGGSQGLDSVSQLQLQLAENMSKLQIQAQLDEAALYNLQASSMGMTSSGIASEADLQQHQQKLAMLQRQLDLQAPQHQQQQLYSSIGSQQSSLFLDNDIAVNGFLFDMAGGPSTNMGGGPNRLGGEAPLHYSAGAVRMGGDHSTPFGGNSNPPRHSGSSSTHLPQSHAQANRLTYSSDLNAHHLMLLRQQQQQLLGGHDFMPPSMRSADPLENQYNLVASAPQLPRLGSSGVDQLRSSVDDHLSSSGGMRGRPGGPQIPTGMNMKRSSVPENELDDMSAVPARFSVLRPRIRRRIWEMSMAIPVIRLQDFDEKVVDKILFLMERYGEGECMKMLDKLSVRMRTKQTMMKNAAGYLDCAVTSYLDMLMQASLNVNPEVGSSAM